MRPPHLPAPELPAERRGRVPGGRAAPSTFGDMGGETMGVVSCGSVYIEVLVSGSHVIWGVGQWGRGGRGCWRGAAGGVEGTMGCSGQHIAPIWPEVMQGLGSPSLPVQRQATQHRGAALQMLQCPAQPAACLRVQLLLGQLDVGGGALAKRVQHARILLHQAVEEGRERVCRGEEWAGQRCLVGR